MMELNTSERLHGRTRLAPARSGSPLRGSIQAFSVLLSCLGLLLAAPADAEMVSFQNDSYTPGDTADFDHITDFQVGEIAAARFFPEPDACPCKIESVSFLYGGIAATIPIRIIVIEEQDPPVTTPESIVYDEEWYVNVSNTDLQVIDLGSEHIFVGGNFRIGVQQVLPASVGVHTFATDTDGTISESGNLYLHALLLRVRIGAKSPG